MLIDVMVGVGTFVGRFGNGREWVGEWKEWCLEVVMRFFGSG